MGALSASLAWGIICVILLIAIYVCVGLVCGRICVELVREKNEDMSEILWFWLGFLANVIGVVLTLIVQKKKKNDESNKE